MDIGVASVIDLPNGHLTILQRLESNSACVRYRVETSERQQLLLQVYKEEDWQDFEHERMLLELLGPHDHVLSLSQAAVVPGPPRTGLLLFESMPIGTLARLSAQVPELSEQQVLNYAKELALGLSFLHSKGVIHCNLSLDNIWVGSDFRCKISGFEASFGPDIPGHIQPCTLSSGTAAPEVSLSLSELAHPATDMWALGCLIYQLLYKEIPFEGDYRGDGTVAQPKPQGRAVTGDWEYLFMRLFMLDQKARAGDKEVCDTLDTFRLEKKGKQPIFPQIPDVTFPAPLPQRKKSNIGTSTYSWVSFAVRDDNFPPDSDCLAKLLAKAWNKPQKIPKFFSKFNKLQFTRTLTVIKSLLVLHCYLFKGPYVLIQTYYEPFVRVLGKCEAMWMTAARDKPDENHTEYLAGLIRQYLKLLTRKLELHVSSKSLGNWQGAELDSICGAAFTYWADMLLLTSRLFIGGKEVLDLRIAWMVQILEDVISLYTVMCRSLPSILEYMDDMSLRAVYVLKFQSNYGKLSSLVRGLQRQRPDIGLLELPETQPEEIQRLMMQTTSSSLQTMDAFLSDGEETKEDQLRSNTVQYPTVKAVAIEASRGRAATEGVSFKPKRRPDSKEPESPGKEKTLLKSLLTSSPSWLILMDELQFKEVLNMGIYFTTYKGIYRRTAVAISVLRSFVQKPCLSSMVEQITLMSRVSHPNLVLFMGAAVGRQTAIVTEYCPGGSLSILLHKRKREELPINVCYSLLRDVARAVHGLHASEPALCHGELTSAAVMLMDETVGLKVQAKVADFGVRNLLDPDRGLGQIGYWTAPEVLEGGEVTPAADIYSFGVLALEVLLRCVPSEAEIRGCCVPSQVPAHLSTLIIQCVQEKPGVRPTSQMLMDVFDSICE